MSTRVAFASCVTAQIAVVLGGRDLKKKRAVQLEPFKSDVGKRIEATSWGRWTLVATMALGQRVPMCRYPHTAQKEDCRW